ncbi:MAG: cob(I)yrinic acid a,c-diamide adenosyltransferase [Deltaproteobacteria bacterium]|nr:cob(I)yrinic acid a,c-diamide adenosyltransferase [Deltaproteobacteria bacterium]
MKKTGLIHVYTGEGKGKTTAAIGLSVRASGAGLKVLFVQFFKEDRVASGEKTFFKNCVGIELIRSNCRHPIFTKEKTDVDSIKKSIRDAYGTVKKKIREDGYNMLVLDEVMSAINGGWIEMEDFISFLKTRPEILEVVLTGRDAPPEIVRLADYVTEMLKLKHPFDSGVNARKGIEF